MKVSDVVDAIEKNGYPKTKGSFYRNTNNEKVYPELGESAEFIVSACAIGQAALNLHTTASELISGLRSIDLESPILLQINLGDAILNLNDQTDYSMAAIAEHLRENLPSEVLDTEVAFV